jgi:hypothetical protein
MRFELPHGQVERYPDISAALIVWLEHASFHGSKSNGLIYARDEHDARGIRWLCECIMPIYGGTVTGQRSVWTLPNGARLNIRYMLPDDDHTGQGGDTATMIIAVNARKWSHDHLGWLTGQLRNIYGIPSRYITTGDIAR